MKKAIFSTEISLLKTTIERLLRRKAGANLTTIIRKTHPADIAFLMRGLNTENQKIIFRLSPTFVYKAQILEELDESLIENVLSEESVANISKTFQYLGTNDQAMIISILPEKQQAAILERLEREDLEDVEEIMSYADDSAGSVMTKETFMLNQNTTIKNAIAQLQSSPENEKVFYVYVVDDQEKLVGVLSLRNLVTSKNTKKLREVMIKDIHAVTSDTDQEEVAKIVAQYNYLALPVVNQQNKFL